MMPATYTWSGGSEAMLRFGPATGPVVIAAMPLFEEANRTRAFIVTILRALADRGIAGILPDLPGTGDSLVRTEATTIMRLRDAYRAVAETVGSEGRPAYGFSVRSAALLDTLALLHGRYQLTPIHGSQVLRELKRVKYVDSRGKTPEGNSWVFSGGGSDAAALPPIEIAGNAISVDLFGALAGSLHFTADEGVPLRIARFASDAQPADIKFAGVPLWRRAEPDNDTALAALITDDIVQWIATCDE